MNLGFYEPPEERPAFTSVTVESEVPAEERMGIQLLRTDSPAFQEVVELRRARNEAFFVRSANRIGLCNVRVPTRLP
mgnify:FL=1